MINLEVIYIAILFSKVDVQSTNQAESFLIVNSGRTATLARRFSHGVTGF